MKRRDFTRSLSVQAVAASTLPSALLASDDVDIEEIDIEKPMDQVSDLVDLFYAHMKLCEVKEGETFLFYATPGIQRKEYITASLAAAKLLGANAFSLVANSPGIGNEGVPTGLPGGAAGGEGSLLGATFVAADVVYGEIPLYNDGHNAALAAGTRTLQVFQPAETLKRMYPHEEVTKRSYAGAEVMRAANEIRVTDDFGSDFTLSKNGRPGHAQVGFTKDKGRWDHWPSGLVACGPIETESNGVYVIKKGDIILSLQHRATSDIKITLEDGRLVKIEGGYDAQMIRERLELFQLPDGQQYDSDGNLNDPFRISHAGWGTEHRAQWQVFGMDSESMYGSVMVSLGRNVFDYTGKYAGLDGENYTPIHIDICCRNKNLYLDGELIVSSDNEIIPPELA
tara:strand:+ start:750 stop:1940 length:1191 start_codon:yes stop_codon:yes gene_type:complete